jgi:imidazolonepropionase-like amidohydrolase
VGEPLWTEIPIYVRDFLAQNHLDMPEVKTPEEAVAQTVRLAEAGVNGIKLFTGSVQGERPVATMPLALVRAACTEAHRRHLPVFAHPQDTAGLEVAIAGGVDVLAHTTPQTAMWTPELVQRLRDARIVLIPTLTLFDFEARKGAMPLAVTQSWLELMLGELRVFSSAGGEVFFGTDVGYTDHYDTGMEFTLMARAGLSFPQILASLTTRPAARFGSETDTGRIATGMEADLVVLDGDPAEDITALAKVHTLLRHGREIYRVQP